MEIRRNKYDDILFPISVSVSPKTMLRGKKLKTAKNIFSESEWQTIFNFISINYRAIIEHWQGETDTFELFDKKFTNQLII